MACKPEALRHARESGEPIQLVLTDAHMPTMDGFRLAEQIRKDPQLAGTLVTMVTSGGQVGMRPAAGNWEYPLTSPSRSARRICWKPLSTFSARRCRTVETPSVVTRHSLREKRRGLQILVAEDNVVNQRLAEHLLGARATR